MTRRGTSVAALTTAAAVALAGATAAPARPGDAVRAGKRTTINKQTALRGKTRASRSGGASALLRATNTGAGGAVTAECRSAALADACLRAGNARTGPAFSFATKGTLIGALLVGDGRTPDPKAAPFTTNATGVATGLNADKVDGLDGEDIRKLAAAGPKGDPGPQGPKGDPGPAGSIAGAAAGGVLTGTYPDPAFALPMTLTGTSDAGPLLGVQRNATTGTQPAIEGTTDSTDSNVVGVRGVVTPATPGGFSAGLRGINNGTGGLGVGVYGSQAGSGWGVYGVTPNGLGVYGNASSSGFGVYANSNTGTGLQATSTAGAAASIDIYNNANANNALRVSTVGNGAAVNASSSGTGPTMVTGRSAPGTALEVNGGLRMRSSGGSGTPAFVHTVNTAGNTCNANSGTVIDNPYANGVATAMLLVTHKGATPFNKPVRVDYNVGGCTAGRWVIETEDATALTNGLTFNVLVITP